MRVGRVGERNFSLKVWSERVPVSYRIEIQLKINNLKVKPSQNSVPEIDWSNRIIPKLKIKKTGIESCEFEFEFDIFDVKHWHHEYFQKIVLLLRR